MADPVADVRVLKRANLVPENRPVDMVRAEQKSALPGRISYSTGDDGNVNRALHISGAARRKGGLHK